MIKGIGTFSKTFRRILGGPQSLLPMAPSKGMSVGKKMGVAPSVPRSYAVPRQSPVLSVGSIRNMPRTLSMRRR